MKQVELVAFVENGAFITVFFIHGAKYNVEHGEAIYGQQEDGHLIDDFLLRRNYDMYLDLCNRYKCNPDTSYSEYCDYYLKVSEENNYWYC